MVKLVDTLDLGSSERKLVQVRFLFSVPFVEKLCGINTNNQKLMHTDYQFPNSQGFFGKYGGQYLPETLIAPIQELTKVYYQAIEDSEFQATLTELLHHYCGRPTPLDKASNWTKHLGGAQIYLKREDLLHGGAHKTNQVLGQALLTKRMGKTEVIAETGGYGESITFTGVGCFVVCFTGPVVSR